MLIQVHQRARKIVGRGTIRMASGGGEDIHPVMKWTRSWAPAGRVRFEMVKESGGRSTESLSMSRYRSGVGLNE
jgi:hypothetical protein